MSVERDLARAIELAHQLYAIRWELHPYVPYNTADGSFVTDRCLAGEHGLDACDGPHPNGYAHLCMCGWARSQHRIIDALTRELVMYLVDQDRKRQLSATLREGLETIIEEVSHDSPL